MSTSSHIQRLVAHYLATNYPSALDPFLKATNLPSPDLASPPQPDLRTLVEDYTSSQISSQLQDVEIEDEPPAQDGTWDRWKGKDIMKLSLDPGIKLEGVRRNIGGISAANLLTVQVRDVPYRDFVTSTAEYSSRYERNIITTSVDKSIKFVDYSTGEVERILQPHQAAILSFDIHPTNSRYLLTSSMDGTTILTDLITLQTLQTFKSTKFVVRAMFSPDGRFFATASYDHNIVIYRATSPAIPSFSAGTALDDQGDDSMLLDEHDDPRMACEPSLRYEQAHRISVDSNPESILFHPQSNWLMYTLRSSHLMHYVELPGQTPRGSDGGEAGDAQPEWTKTSKSFNPHPFDDHVSFSVLNMVLHPSGRIIACQTGDHRGSAGERILLYGVEPEETERLGCIWTGNDVDDFVLPRMAWLPDGKGFVTTSPNGYLNLLNINGEVRSSIKVHGGLTELGQASSEVVRDVAVVQDGNDWAAVSVGYDRVIRISS